MVTYYDDGTIRIRSMIPEDAQILYDTYFSYGWHPSLATYEKYYKEQEDGKRFVCIAEYDGRVSGQGVLYNVHYPINPEDMKEKGCDYVAALRKVNQSYEY